MSEILLQGGLVVDPATQREGKGDVLIRDGKIVECKATKDAVVVKVDGLVVTPGLIDPHVHLSDCLLYTFDAAEEYESVNFGE